MQKIQNNHQLGAVLAVIGMVAGLLLLYFLADTYNDVISTHFNDGAWEESNTVRVVYAVLGWFGIAAGALSGSVLYGFLKKEPWAWFWGGVAGTILLLAGFFPMIPAADSGLSTPTMMVFGLAAVMWFGMLFIGGVNNKIIALTFVAGLAYVLTFIDGVAPFSKYQTTYQAPGDIISTTDAFWNGIYVMLQQVNWWGSAAWAGFIFASWKGKSWAVPLGIFAALMSMIGGYPLGINSMTEVGRFSMFLPAPMLSTLLLIVLLLPSTQRLITSQNES